MKGRALRRALQTSQPERLVVALPQFTDTTELITAERAHELLMHNKKNRPTNWRKVEEYSDIMARGEWQLHSQGIILDPDGNIITGQTRLWAVIYSGTSVHMRVSRGTPRSAETVIDRGRPQSARDLATRKTERTHSPTESSIARAVLALRGNLRPTVDNLSSVILEHEKCCAQMLAAIRGTKKTKGLLMILAVILELYPSPETVLIHQCQILSVELEKALAPTSANTCWGRGAAFSLALEVARKIVEAKGISYRGGTESRPINGRTRGMG